MEGASRLTPRKCRPLPRHRLILVLVTTVALLCAASPALAANTLFVDASAGSDTSNCQSQASPCQTITYAVSQAGDGDTVQIAKGTYTEAVSTGLDLSFVGAGSSGQSATTIDATGTGASALALSGTDSVAHLALTTRDQHAGAAMGVSGSGEVTANDLAITAPGGATDGVNAAGASLSLTNATISATNADADVENNSSSSPTVSDGSAVEVSAGTLTVASSSLTATEGIALHIDSSATQTTVGDSVLVSNGNVPAGYSGQNTNQWQAVAVGGGQVSLTFDTVVNQTIGQSNTNTSAPPADALWVAPTPGVAVTLADSVLRAQPTSAAIANGSDIDANEDVTATTSAFTTVNAAGGVTVTAPGTAGNIPGDPGFVSAGLTLAAGSPLLGAGNPSDAQQNEVDLSGAPRTTGCPDGAIVNIGAYESAVPPCPAAPAADSTGPLSQLTGAGNCITGDSQASSGCNTSGVAGLTGGPPQDAVVSPDGKNVYAVAEDPSGASTDVVELDRAAGGQLAPLPAPDNCISGSSAQASGCGTGDDAALLYVIGANNQPSPTPARLAISPDGANLYVDNGYVLSAFSRDPSTGALTPLPDADCIDQTNADASCSSQQQGQMFTAAALEVSPDGKDLYLATRNGCEPSGSGASGVPNPNCNNNPNLGFSAQADVAVFARDSQTGVLSPGPCYSNANTATTGCAIAGLDGLYSMTSLTFSPDGVNVYVSTEGGANPGALSEDPGEVDAFTRDASTGALTPLGGAGACTTAGSACGTNNTGTTGVTGMIDPQQVVVSPDGKDAYVTSAQYVQTNGSRPSLVDSGTLVASTLTQLERDPVTGALSSLPGATCFAGEHEGCFGQSGPSAAVTQVPGFTGAEGLTITPDGRNVYASAVNPGTSSGLAEFSRDPASGRLSPLSSPHTCLSNGAPPGASGPFACGTTSLAGVQSSIEDLPGGVVISPDCTSAYLLSDGIAAFSRPLPAGATGCASAAKPGPAAVQFSTASLSFGPPPVPVGTTSAPQSVRLTNTGQTTLHLETVALAGAGASRFSILSDGCSGQALGPGGACTVAVTFAPNSPGAVSAALQFTDDASDSPQTITLTGDGGEAAVSLSPTSLSFTAPAPLTSASQTVTVTDVGTEPLKIATVGLTGATPSAFSFTADACTGKTVAAGASCTVSIAFHALGVRTYTAQLTIADDAADSPQTVALSATGAQAMTVYGTVSNITASPPRPVGQVPVYACSATSRCVSTTTAADGSYRLLHLGSGSWRVQVSPPLGLGAASADVVIAPGQLIKQDFALQGPRPLSARMSIDGQTGGYSTTPDRNPYTLTLPLPISRTGAPHTTQLSIGFGGMEGDNENPNQGQNVIQMGMIMFAARYNGAGQLVGVTRPLMGSLNCDASPGVNAACAALARAHTGDRSGAPAGAQDGSSSCTSAGGPSAPALPDVVGPQSAVVDPRVTGAKPPEETSIIQPDNGSGGIHTTIALGNGTVIPFVIGSAQIPQLAGANPWANAAINLTNPAINLDPFASVYGFWAGLSNALTGAHQTLPSANGARWAAGATWTIMADNFGGPFHGGVQLFWNLFSGELGSRIQPGSPVPVTFSSCQGGSADAYREPSGMVRTPSGIPIAGARVTLRRSATATGPSLPVPPGSLLMAPANRRNPMLTGPLGLYGWDVVPGLYQVTASHRGCTVPRRRGKAKVTSPRLTVPPAGTGIDLVLSCPALARRAVGLRLTVVKARDRFSLDLLEAKVIGARGQRPQGLVTFAVGRRVLGSAMVIARTGVARFVLPAFLNDRGAVRVRYGGDAAYAPAIAHGRL